MKKKDKRLLLNTIIVFSLLFAIFLTSQQFSIADDLKNYDTITLRDDTDEITVPAKLDRLQDMLLISRIGIGLSIVALGISYYMVKRL